MIVYKTECFTHKSKCDNLTKEEMRLWCDSHRRCSYKIEPRVVKDK